MKDGSPVEVFDETGNTADTALGDASDRSADHVSFRVFVTAKDLEECAEDVEDRDDEGTESDRSERVGRSTFESAESHFRCAGSRVVVSLRARERISDWQQGNDRRRLQ